MAIDFEAGAAAATSSRIFFLLKRQLRPTLLPGITPCSANLYTVLIWILRSSATIAGVMISSIFKCFLSALVSRRLLPRRGKRSINHAIGTNCRAVWEKSRDLQHFCDLRNGEKESSRAALIVKIVRLSR